MDISTSSARSLEIAPQSMLFAATSSIGLTETACVSQPSHNYQTVTCTFAFYTCPIVCVPETA